MPDGQGQTPMQRMMGDFAPTLVSLTVDVLFGQVWADPTLSPRDRSLVTITSLVSAGNIEQLNAHIPMGLANGLTEEEIKAAITHVAFHAGYAPTSSRPWPRSWPASSSQARSSTGRSASRTPQRATRPWTPAKPSR